MTTIVNENDLSIETVHTKKASLVFRAINHTLRRQMLQLLHQHKRMTVTEVFIKLRLEQSVTSQHLGILRKAGLVQTQREGKFIYYSVNYARMEQVHELAEKLNAPLPMKPELSSHKAA